MNTTPFQAAVQLDRKLVVRRLRSAWEGADHHHALSGQQGSALAGQVTQSPQHLVPGDGGADGLGDHEPDPWSRSRTLVGVLGGGHKQVHHHQRTTAATATAHDLSEMAG